MLELQTTPLGRQAGRQNILPLLMLSGVHLYSFVFIAENLASTLDFLGFRACLDLVLISVRMGQEESKLKDFPC